MKISKGNSCVTCLKCGTVAFAVSRQYAEDEVSRFNTYYNTLSDEDKEMFGSGANINNYIYCWCKNPYTNFRDAKDGDYPDGVTMSPILDRGE